MPVQPARRALAGWAVVIIVGVGVLAARGGADAAPAGVDVARGESLYAAYCTACHGQDGAGRPGQDRTAGPPLTEVDAAYIDLTLRTGRMPLRAPEVGVDLEPGFDVRDADREAIVAWTVETFDLADSRPAEEVVTGDVAPGRELYAQHCAACHGATGGGGVAGDGTLIRALTGDGGVASVEAMLVGPFRMPRFEEVLDDSEMADVAAFVDVLDDQPATPLGLTEVDRVTMALLVVPVLVGLAGVVVLVGRRVDIAEGHESECADP